ncbi:MAG: deoxyguanosinetriphosphate triphosphohydrolase [Phycisphaerae bacterium]
MSGVVTTGLAPYAVGGEDCGGRVHQEPADSLRNPFELDRHRILACAAFRRLQYKTQVFVYDEHDHFRTRLTHTLEVAEVARRLAVALNANEQLAEVCAMAHDLGHPPFGHAGEATLRELMADAGGFEHNTHALRIVDYLEHPYPDFRGLNLSFELRESLIKHSTEYDKPDISTIEGLEVSELLACGPLPTIEAQIACAADRIAYDCHDLEDALGAQMIGEEQLADVRLWKRFAHSLRERHPRCNVFAIRRPILNAMLDELINDCVDRTRHRLTGWKAGPTGGGLTVQSVDAVRNAEATVVGFSDEQLEELRELEGFLAQHVYRHYRLARMDAKARRFVEALFNAFVEDPAMLPPRFAARVDAQGPQRVVCDYLAGMTDRFCHDEYDRLFQPHERV